MNNKILHNNPIKPKPYGGEEVNTIKVRLLFIFFR